MRSKTLTTLLDGINVSVKTSEDSQMARVDVYDPTGAWTDLNGSKSFGFSVSAAGLTQMNKVMELVESVVSGQHPLAKVDCVGEFIIKVTDGPALNSQPTTGEEDAKFAEILKSKIIESIKVHENMLSKQEQETVIVQDPVAKSYQDEAENLAKQLKLAEEEKMAALAKKAEDDLVKEKVAKEEAARLEQEKVIQRAQQEKLKAEQEAKKLADQKMIDAAREEKTRKDAELLMAKEKQEKEKAKLAQEAVASLRAKETEKLPPAAQIPSIDDDAEFENLGPAKKPAPQKTIKASDLIKRNAMKRPADDDDDESADVSQPVIPSEDL